VEPLKAHPNPGGAPYFGGNPGRNTQLHGRLLVFLAHQEHEIGFLGVWFSPFTDGLVDEVVGDTTLRTALLSFAKILPDTHPSPVFVGAKADIVIVCQVAERVTRGPRVEAFAVDQAKFGCKPDHARTAKLARHEI